MNYSTPQRMYWIKTPKTEARGIRCLAEEALTEKQIRSIVCAVPDKLAACYERVVKH